MKSLIFALFLSTAFTVSAQVWGNEGATWHYQWGGLSLFDGLFTITYEADTVIDGYSSQIIKTKREYFYPNNTVGPVTIFTDFTRYSGDSVFWYKDSSFFLMFDFGATIGDSWVVHNDHGSDPYCDSVSLVNVIDTGTVVINGQVLRYLDVQRSPNSNYGYSGRIYERMGSIAGGFSGYFWPTKFECDSAIYEYIYWEFNCYQDDAFNLYSPSAGMCNPFEDVGVIELSSNEKSILKMYDLLGREIDRPKANQIILVQFSDGTVEKRNFSDL